MTINKAQGYRLKRVEIYLLSPVFPPLQSVGVRCSAEPLRLITSLLAMLKGDDSVQKMRD